jgi:transposase
MNNQKTRTPKSTTTQNKNAAGVSSSPLHEQMLLGLDVHSEHIRMVRQIDGTNPQPAQRLSWEQIEEFCRKQLTLAKHVYAVYEAGAFGYGLQRRLSALGVVCYVIHPVKLDPRHRGVQTDKTDACELCLMLGRYVAGSRKAMAVVHVPTVEQENKRIEARHRHHLKKEVLRLQAHGRGLLLFQGFRHVGKWWQPVQWERLKSQLSPQLCAGLEDDRVLIEQAQKLLKPVEKKLVASVPKTRPRGMGALTLALLWREILDWGRFQTRRQVGGYLGLGGGVSSSANQHYELGITKAGNAYLRTLLVELAWRMVYYQPDCHAVGKWKAILTDPKSSRRRRKGAIVAVSRQLAVDLWKWQTGQLSAQQLGWEEIQAAA